MKRKCEVQINGFEVEAAYLRCEQRKCLARTNLILYRGCQNLCRNGSEKDRRQSGVLNLDFLSFVGLSDDCEEYSLSKGRYCTSAMSV